MNLLKTLLLILPLVACATKTIEKETIKAAVEREEVRNFTEIERHSKLLVQTHPELSEKTKDELEGIISLALKRAQALRDEESQIVQLLLSKSVRAKDLTFEENKTKSALIKRLDKVYSEKEKNVLTVIAKIKEFSDRNEINEGLEKDMMIFMREIR